MATTNINVFFTGKTLSIPAYQRDYAWTGENIDDLFEDIEEALAVGSSHYIGTFILCQTSSGEPFSVVDGQQRLTTLTILLDALIEKVTDPAIQAHYKNTFINNPISGQKFKLLGANNLFFQNLLLGEDVIPVSDGQERLKTAYYWIKGRAEELYKNGGQKIILRWLDAISKFEALEFIEVNEGKAIRMFQTVNDRGVLLSKIDIVKSLLVYYSNRYLDKINNLDTYIATQFGEVFRSFSQLKNLAKEPGYLIHNINNDLFDEDSILRYHYLSYQKFPSDNNLGGSYKARVDDVLSLFLKPALKDLRNTPKDLKDFIKDYTDDLLKFFQGLEALIKDTRKDRNAYIFWVIQNPSATLYPLLIRLHLMDFLKEIGSIKNNNRTLYELIELTDMRAFKFGGNPQADIFNLTRNLSISDVNTVAKALLDFCASKMSNDDMKSKLISEKMYANSGIKRMLLAIEDQYVKLAKRPQLKISDLVKLNIANLTVEHIFPQDPENNFSVRNHGFRSHDEYLKYQDILGNLILLENTVNIACGNASPTEKMNHPRMYLRSAMQAVIALRAQYPQGIIFKKQDMIGRSSDMAKIIIEYWHI